MVFQGPSLKTNLEFSSLGCSIFSVVFMQIEDKKKKIIPLKTLIRKKGKKEDHILIVLLNHI